MSSYGKYIEAQDILQIDGLQLQEVVEQDDAIYDSFDEFKLRRIYTYIKMFKVMNRMIDEDITLIKKFNPLFDALFEKYCIVALDREWTKKDFLYIKSALKNIHRINEKFIEYHDIINNYGMKENMNDSDSDNYDEIKEEMNKKIYIREHNELDKTNHPVNLKPFISPYNIQNEINEDNEITTKTLLKKVIDMRDESGRDILEMLIKTKTKSITIKFIDEQN